MKKTKELTMVTRKRVDFVTGETSELVEEKGTGVVSSTEEVLRKGLKGLT